MRDGPPKNEDAVGVLIVDDEEPARSILRQHLEDLPGVRILGECANGFDALKSATLDSHSHSFANRGRQTHSHVRLQGA